jgi:hypothetical protein
MLMLVVLQAEPGSALVDRLLSVGHSAAQLSLNVALALLVMLIGWGVAALVGGLVRGILHLVHFGDAVRRLLGPRAAAIHDPAVLAARTVYWVLLAATALVALEFIGIGLAAQVADRLSDVVPRIVTSAVLFAVGALVAMVLGALTRRFLESAEIRAARFHGQLVYAVLTGFAALLALEQLGLAAQFVMGIGLVAVAAASLGLALAFGLGCRELARDFLVEYLRSLDEEGPRRPG